MRALVVLRFMSDYFVPPTSPLIQFGQRLAVLRKERGISQEELALMSGIARSYVGGVERGKRNISLLNIVRLAETLNVSPAEFFGFSGEQ